MSFFPTAAVDVVGLFDVNFQPIFAEARPIKATIKETSKVMEHPVESGATIIDHRIILPIKIELLLALSSAVYRDTYRYIHESYLKSRLLTVQTKAGSYANMLITEMPHDEDPETFDCIVLTLKLKEALFVTAQYTKLPAQRVKNKAHASTIDRGEQSAKSIKKESLLHRLIF